MTTVNQAVTWGNPWIGYRDNGGKKMWMLGSAPHWPGAAWCGKTCAVRLEEAGMKPPWLPYAQLLYVPNAVVAAKKADRWITSYQSSPGDLVVLDWSLSGHRDGLADHIGMIIRNDRTLPYVDTVEGNTNDANNDGPRGFFYRRRYRADILGCISLQKEYSGPVYKVPEVGKATSQDLNQWLDAATIRQLQRVLGVTADGVVGPVTLKAWQKRGGTPQDGVLSAGYSTLVHKVQVFLNGRWNAGGARLSTDGVVGPKTAAALKSYLSRHGAFTGLAGVR